MADLISPSLDRQTARGLTDRLKLPLVVAPMFKVSTPELVVASCRAGAIGSFPSINARTPGLFDDWMTRIAGELDAARAAGETPAPMAVNLLTHDSNPRFEPDFAIVRKWEPPFVITSAGRSEVVIDAVHGYGGLVFADVVSLHHARRAARCGVARTVLLYAGAGGQ